MRSSTGAMSSMRPQCAHARGPGLPVPPARGPAPLGATIPHRRSESCGHRLGRTRRPPNPWAPKYLAFDALLNCSFDALWTASKCDTLPMHADVTVHASHTPHVIVSEKLLALSIVEPLIHSLPQPSAAGLGAHTLGNTDTARERPEPSKTYTRVYVCTPPSLV